MSALCDSEPEDLLRRDDVDAQCNSPIASLAVYFSLHTLFDSTRAVNTGPLHLELPVLSTWDPLAFALTAVARALMFWRGWSPLRTLGICAALGLIATLVA